MVDAQHVDLFANNVDKLLGERGEVQVGEVDRTRTEEAVGDRLALLAALDGVAVKGNGISGPDQRCAAWRVCNIVFVGH